MSDGPDHIIDRTLDAMDLPRGDLRELPGSDARFPDGARFRIEIPSTEGPECLSAVVEEAVRLEVPVHRVSQGSGVFMLTDAELDRTARIGADAGIEVSLFARPSAGWAPSAASRAPAGGALASASWGQDQVRYAMADILRAAEHGFRSVLIGDVGVLAAFGQLRAAGDLPADMQAKVSVMLSAANPATARVFEDLGAETINVPSDLSLAQIAAIRSAVSIPLDIYIESPDILGGFIRMHEAPELVRIASPVHLKLGLRNAPDVYPSGAHLHDAAVAMSRERVRRARLAMELLERSGVALETSKPGAAGIAVPQPA